MITKRELTLNQVDLPLLLVHYQAYSPKEEVFTAINTLLHQPAIRHFRPFIALPSAYLEAAGKAASAGVIKLDSELKPSFGADRHLSMDKGAFTASIATRLIKEGHGEFVLIGSFHERKAGAKDASLAAKVSSALKEELTPIFSVSDTLYQYEEGCSAHVIKEQLQPLCDLLKELPCSQQQKIHLLYDPPWISEGAFPADSKELFAAYDTFRTATLDLLGITLASEIKWLYALPAYSRELSAIIENLPAHGYSLGSLPLSYKMTLEGEVKLPAPPIYTIEESLLEQALEESAEQLPSPPLVEEE